MKNHKFLFILLLSTLIYEIKAVNLVVIECSFPCLMDDQVCEVTSLYVKCKQRTNKTSWALKNINSIPEYQGPLIELGQSCMKAPQPKLKNVSHLSISTSESVMDWPTVYDAFYNNCDDSFYCDKANICVKQLALGEVCESNNQCFQGICHQNTCQKDMNHNNNSSGGDGLTTIHIILTVVGVVLFLCLVFGIYMILRYRKKLINNNNDINKEQQEDIVIPLPPLKKVKTTSRSCSTASTSSSDSSSNHHVTNILSSPDYDPQFFMTALSPPPTSRQQQELQFQFVSQMSPAPPPYSP